MYTTCRVGVLSSEISKYLKISPPPSLRSHLISSPMGVLSVLSELVSVLLCTDSRHCVNEDRKAHV